MIDLYTWPTPNGHKVHIMLEELRLAYRIIPIDISRGDQFKPAFLKISPNNKMPAMVDRDGPGGRPYAMFESGAMLVYLAEKTGKFMPKSVRGRFDVMQWLMFQMGTVGPMLGQTHHFRNYTPRRIQYAFERYSNEARRIYGVMDQRLSKSGYLAGARYSIADIATFPWIVLYQNQGIDLADFRHVKRWLGAIDSRPAVQRGMGVLDEEVRRWKMDARTREALFGATQYKRRRAA